MKRYTVRVLLSVAAFAGCSSEDVAGTDAPIQYPENRGALVTTGVSTSSGLRWEKPEEIVYHSFVPGVGPAGGESHLRSIGVADMGRKVLDGPRPGDSRHGFLTVSPDGNQVYFGAGTAPMLYRVVPGTAPELLTGQSRPSGLTQHSSSGGSVLATPDSRYAAYVVAPDSVRIYDALARTSRPLTRGCRGLIAFSPDAQQLLCGSGDLFMVNVADGLLSSYALPAARTASSLLAAQWSERGLQLIFPGSLSLIELVNVTTGVTTRLLGTEELRAAEFTQVQNITMSRDGKRVAIVSFGCDRFGCPVTQTILNVVDIGTRQLRRVAVINHSAGATENVGQLAFSPDGGRLAYIYGAAFASIFVVPVQ